MDRRELLESYLAECEARYDPACPGLGQKFHSPGYHSRVPEGTWVHATRESLDYALALLQAGGADREARSGTVIAHVLTFQDTDPFSRTYGIWPWVMEEPLARMNPPDWNWADFLGARLAQMLIDHAGQLPAELAGRMRTSLGHAAWAVFRRNVQLDYTNIAIMGGGLAAAAGELLGEPRLLEFGRERLRRVVELARYHGSFTEYNSPTYTLVALEECERVLHLCRDADVRASAEALRRVAWTVIAEHFHPGTQQWAGPQSRSYSDLLRPGPVQYLAEQTGAALTAHPTVAAASVSMRLVPALPCPDDLRGLFTALPRDPLEVRSSFVKLGRNRPEEPAWLAAHSPPPPGGPSKPRYADRVGTTWMTADACLGSISHDDLWNQRRPLLGYWRTPADPAVVLRVRFLHDGRDFASAYLRSVQAGPRVLSAATFLTDRGDFHPFFDHPPDAVFQAEDLRLRYELSGEGAGVAALGGGRFALSAGSRRAVVHAAAGRFGEAEIRWETGGGDGRVWVDAVCFQGVRSGVPLGSLSPVILTAGVELLAGTESATDETPRVAAGGETYSVSWRGLSLDVPLAAHAYPV